MQHIGFVESGTTQSIIHVKQLMFFLRNPWFWMVLILSPRILYIGFDFNMTLNGLIHTSPTCNWDNLVFPEDCGLILQGFPKVHAEDFHGFFSRGYNMI